MGERRLLVVGIFVCLIASACGRELNVEHELDHAPVYNHTLAKIMVEYASAVYMSDLTALFTWTCSRCTDLVEDFEIIEVVIDVQHCLQAFVGVAQDLNAVVIAFRGTHDTSIRNWISDLSWRQLDLNYPDMDDAMVHHGFYSAYHNTTVRNGILGAVKKAKEYYGGDLGIMVTGHSMGAAMAAFCGLDLAVNFKEENVQVMTFGQPRIGNAAFASYYTQLVPNTIRIVNDHDIVPHLPPYYPYFAHKTYHHFPREISRLQTCGTLLWISQTCGAFHGFCRPSGSATWSTRRKPRSRQLFSREKHPHALIGRSENTCQRFCPSPRVCPFLWYLHPAVACLLLQLTPATLLSFSAGCHPSPALP